MSLSIIHSVAETTAHRDRDDINHSMAQVLLQFLDAESVAVYGLVDANDARSVERSLMLTREQEPLPANTTDSSDDMPQIEGLPAWRYCLLTRDVVHGTTPAGRPWCLFPLENDRGVIGFLAIETRTPVASRDAGLVGGILRILKNHLALLDYGELDTLTGLLNRKTFEAKFVRLRQHRCAPETAHHEASWLGIVDIDKFKSINDGYGHLFGDEVLLLVAGLMKNNFRGADQLFRFGGEEFIIVLDRASAQGAEIAFERLRAAIEAYRFPQLGRVTISLGYTQIQPHDAPNCCVERADAALYFAKHNGRNNVRGYEALIEMGALAPKASAVGDTELF